MDSFGSSIRPQSLTGIYGFDSPGEGRLDRNFVSFFSLDEDLFSTVERTPSPPWGYILKAFKVEPQLWLGSVNPCVPFQVNQVYLSKQKILHTRNIRPLSLLLTKQIQM